MTRPRPSIPAAWDSYDILPALAPYADSYLCVGVQEGECLRRVVTANPKLRRLALCDTWGPHHGGTNRGSHDHIAALLQGLGYTGAVSYLDGMSQHVIPQLDAADVFDLSLVDGAHDEASAYTDFVNVWPRSRWAMICHDLRMPPVFAALARFVETTPNMAMHCAMGGHGTAVLYRE